MKVLTYILIIAAYFSCTSSVQAQEKAVVDQAYRAAAVARLGELLIEHYVYEDVARKTADHLKAQLKSGQFDELDELEAFAGALTTSVQSVNKDKHMRIRPRRTGEAPEHTPERLTDDLLDHYEYRRRVVAGFSEARKIEGNIGYLDLRGFAGVDWGAEVADRYMYLLAGSDALIIDLRKNGGGDPAMVQYLCSYFFAEKVHLNSLYWRRGDRTEEFWTLDKVGGTKMPDVPIFILTSNYTFSGAEEFSYNMQTRKRATLVGETTGGGANPGGGFQINEELTVFIPTGAAINPVTKTNWEGVGVVPEVKVPAEEGLDKAIELATTAAEAYRNKSRKKYRMHLQDLQTALDKYQAGASEDEIMKHLQVCQQLGLLKEQDINLLGYEFLQGLNKPDVAEVIFKGNTILYPESANTYDSYGEALAANGKLKTAVKIYEKAVELAKANEDANLELFKENLARVKGKVAEK